jgi:hypothetical protein
MEWFAVRQGIGTPSSPGGPILVALPPTVIGLPAHNLDPDGCDRDAAVTALA